MSDVESVKNRLRGDAYRKRLARLYCCPEDETDLYAVRCMELVDAFAQTFGPEGDVAIFSAPGRTEIGGNHTDHQHGCVLAGSVNLDILAAARPNGLNEIRLLSESETVERIPLGDLRPVRNDRFTSRALVRGVAAKFLEKGCPVHGFDVCAVSMVLKGSGLSSSAAFEVLIGTIINELFCGGAASATEIARFGQYAENVYFDKPCGLMDQLACSVGGVLFIDFKDEDNPPLKKVAFDLGAAGHALCIVDSGADHADMSHIYASIPEEMGRVAEVLGKPHLGVVSENDFRNSLPLLREKAGDRAVLRALHFFGETRRAAEEAEALEKGRFDDFLSLVNASGRSSYMYLQNVIPPGAEREQAVAFALAMCDAVLDGRGAYRVHGGGFAGTVQAFVPLDLLATFSLEIEAALGRGRCHILTIRPDGGVRVL